MVVWSVNDKNVWRGADNHTTPHQQQPQQPQAAPLTFAAYNEDDTEREVQSHPSELWKIAQVFLHFPNNKDYPFKHTFLNSAQTTTPNQTTDLNGYAYVEAMEQARKYPCTAGRFIPTEVIGFKDLHDRVQKQDVVVARHGELLKEIGHLLESRKQEARTVREKVTEIKRTQALISLQLLKVLQKLELSEEIIAAEWHNGKFRRNNTVAAEEGLHALEEKMNAPMSQGLMARVLELAKTSKDNAGSAQSSLGPQKQTTVVDEQHSQQIRSCLENYRVSILQMRGTLSKAQRDIAIMQGRAGG